MEELGRRFAAERPEAVIVADAARRARRRALRRRSLRRCSQGDAVAVDATPTRATRGRAIPSSPTPASQALQADGLPALGITFGATAAGVVDDAARLGRADPALVHARPRRRRQPVPCPLERRARAGGRGARRRDRAAAGRADRERRPRPRPHRRRPVRLRAPSRRQYDERDPGDRRATTGSGELAELGPGRARSPRRPTASGSC